MDRFELKQVLDERGIPEGWYTLPEDVPRSVRRYHAEGSLHLEQRDGRWCVYQYERGESFNVKGYDDEPAACADFLARVGR